MAQVELFFHKRRSFVGDIGAVHYERLSVLIRVGGVRCLECIVDTGAYLTVFPQDAWNRFREQIHWCSVADESRLPLWCKQFISAATGGPCPCRLGRLAIEVIDSQRPRRVIGPTDIFALFAADQGKLSTPLFGLGGNALAGRRLLVADDLHRAVLRET